MKNFIKRLLQKWVDKMRYKIEHDVVEPDYDLANILKPETKLHQAELGRPEEIDELDIRRNKELAEDFKEFVEHGNKVGWHKIYEKYGTQY